MHRTLLLLMAAAPGAAGASVRGITDGADDDGDPAVVALVGGGAIRCSGALVSPRVVLTAAHCLVPPPEVVFFGSAPELGGVSIAQQGRLS